MKPEESNLVRQGLLPRSEQIQKFLQSPRMIRTYKEELMDRKTIAKLCHEVVRYASPRITNIFGYKALRMGFQ